MNQSFLGLDLGAGAIKLVELRNEKGRPRLATYGIYEVELDLIASNDWSKRKKEAISAIKLLVEQSRASSNLVASALPTFAVFSSVINVPAVEPKELENAIRIEAKKVVPRPLEEMNFDYKEIQSGARQAVSGEVGDNDSQLARITSPKKTGVKKMLITAAPKDLVSSYIEIIKAAGLRLVSLETEAIALSRSLVGKDPSVIMVVDIGAKTTNLSIIDQGVPVVNRGVAFGGQKITDALAQRMGLNKTQVEQWKRDFGSTVQDQALSGTVKDLLDDLLHDITYVFQLYRSQFAASAGIAKLVLAGGASFIPGLPQHLAQTLNVPVHRGDPWARIVYPEDLTPVLQEIGPAMAVAVGLAMRHIHIE